MGCIGGAAWHGIKGIRNAPTGARFSGAYQMMVLKAPGVGGGFAQWGGMFSVFDCGLSTIRQKDDPLNAVASGALTGAVLAIRSE